MKALVLKNANDVAIQECPMPVLDNDEVLIKVAYAGICGSDMHAYMGHFSFVRYPVIMGHEFSGTILDIKTNTNVNFGINDNVLVMPYLYCSSCEFCVQGRHSICPDLKVLGFETNGCFAEYIKVPIANVHKISADTDLRIAALAEPLAVAVNDVRKSNLKVGQSVLVIGGGPIGALISIISRLTGAAKVVISEINENRNRILKNMGFEIIDPSRTDAEKEALKMTNGRGFDVVFEASGTSQGCDLMVKAVKRGGTIDLVGMPAKPYMVQTEAIIVKQLKIIGVNLYDAINFVGAIDILKSGMINDLLPQIITNEFPLIEGKEALDFVKNTKNHCKVILKL